VGIGCVGLCRAKTAPRPDCGLLVEHPVCNHGANRQKNSRLLAFGNTFGAAIQGRVANPNVAWGGCAPLPR